jgi:hypothetical protein
VSPPRPPVAGVHTPVLSLALKSAEDGGDFFTILRAPPARQEGPGRTV